MKGCATVESGWHAGNGGRVLDVGFLISIFSLDGDGGIDDRSGAARPINMMGLDIIPVKIYNRRLIST